jgi:hypothetical protein
MLQQISGVLLALALTSAAGAEVYPSKPVTLVVPFAAGGPTDVLARLVSDHMSRTLAKPILIENAVGAASVPRSLCTRGFPTIRGASRPLECSPDRRIF